MRKTEKLLLNCLQAGKFVRFENGVFSFKPYDSDWQKLEEMNLIDSNGRFVGQGAYYQPLPNPKDLSHAGLNKGVANLVSELTERFLKGTTAPSEAVIAALEQFIAVVNSRVESIEFEPHAEFADVVNEVEVVEEVVKPKKSKKKSA